MLLRCTAIIPDMATQQLHDNKKRIAEIAAGGGHDWFITHRFWEENTFEYTLHPSRQSFVLYSDLGRYDFKLPYYEILFCYTHPNHRSQRMFSEQLAAIEEVAKKNGKYVLAQSTALHIPS